MFPDKYAWFDKDYVVELQTFSESGVEQLDRPPKLSFSPVFILRARPVKLAPKLIYQS
jgi:hypothetical protein